MDGMKIMIAGNLRRAKLFAEQYVQSTYLVRRSGVPAGSDNHKTIDMTVRNSAEQHRLRNLIIATSRNPRVAHFVDVGQSENDVPTALCGFAGRASQLDPVPSPAGTLPCEVCARNVSVDGTDQAHETELPADDEDSSETYGVGLRGELVRHDIPEAPRIHRYEGREVIITDCGAIAFLVFGTPPERYESCPECGDEC